MSCAETGISWDNYVNTIAADALETKEAKSSPATSLNRTDKQVFVCSNEEEF